MHKFFCLLISLLVLNSCTSSNTKDTAKDTAISTTKSADTTKQKGNSFIQRTLDSLDKEVTQELESGSDNIQKASLSMKDSTINVYANIRMDYRIFGYEKPDVMSKKMILFSVFTADVSNNPYNCTYGSYYGTDNIELKCLSQEGDFIKANVSENNSNKGTVYIDKRWIEVEE